MNNRIEKLQDNIDETTNELEQINIVVQQLQKTETEITDITHRSKITNTIDYFNSQAEFLEDMKESDEMAIQTLI